MVKDTVVYVPEKTRYFLQKVYRDSPGSRFEDYIGYPSLEEAIEACNYYTLLDPEYDYQVVERVWDV